MSTVVVTPVPSGASTQGFCAFSDDTTAFGQTVGQAIDALAGQLDSGHEATFIVVRRPSGDSFFSAAQHARLTELMTKWRAARDSGAEFPKGEREELETLIREETAASGCRAADIRKRIGT